MSASHVMTHHCSPRRRDVTGLPRVSRVGVSVRHQPEECERGQRQLLPADSQHRERQAAGGRGGRVLGFNKNLSRC